MHLVQVSENSIIDLDGGRMYDWLPAYTEDTDMGSASDRVRCGDMMADTMEWSSHYQLHTATPEEISKTNQQAARLWQYLLSQCKFDATQDAVEIPGDGPGTYSLKWTE